MVIRTESVTHLDLASDCWGSNHFHQIDCLTTDYKEEYQRPLRPKTYVPSDQNHEQAKQPIRQTFLFSLKQQRIESH
jgi:hypothetical protein